MRFVGSKWIKDFLQDKDPWKTGKEKKISLYVIIFIIKIYQFIISPLLGPNCRFTPTCSSYSILAIKKFGIKKGIILSIKRIGRCHPWSKGGYDPLP